MRPLFALAVFALLPACAWATAVPVKPGETTKGFPIYGVRPLIRVSGNTVDVIVVPNTSERYAVRFGSFLAKNEIEADFAGGFITGFKSKQDSTAVIIKLFDVIGDVGKEVIGKFTAFSGDADGSTGTDVRLYDVRFDENGNVTLVELLTLTDQNLVDAQPDGNLDDPFDNTPTPP